MGVRLPPPVPQSSRCPGPRGRRRIPGRSPGISRANGASQRSREGLAAWSGCAGKPPQGIDQSPGSSTDRMLACHASDRSSTLRRGAKSRGGGYSYCQALRRMRRKVTKPPRRGYPPGLISGNGPPGRGKAEAAALQAERTAPGRPRPGWCIDMRQHSPRQGRGPGSSPGSGR